MFSNCLQICVSWYLHDILMSIYKDNLGAWLASQKEKRRVFYMLWTFFFILLAPLWVGELLTIALLCLAITKDTLKSSNTASSG